MLAIKEDEPAQLMLASPWRPLAIAGRAVEMPLESMRVMLRITPSTADTMANLRLGR